MKNSVSLLPFIPTQNSHPSPFPSRRFDILTFPLYSLHNEKRLCNDVLCVFTTTNQFMVRKKTCKLFSYESLSLIGRMGKSENKKDTTTFCKVTHTCWYQWRHISISKSQKLFFLFSAVYIVFIIKNKKGQVKSYVFFTFIHG